MLEASRPMMCTDYEISSTRVGMESVEGETDIQRLCSSGSEVEPRDDSPPTASPFTLSTSFEEDILDLKWWQSQSVDLKCTSHLTHPLTLYHPFYHVTLNFVFSSVCPLISVCKWIPRALNLKEFTVWWCQNSLLVDVCMCVCVRMILCLLYKR